MNCHQAITDKEIEEAVHHGLQKATIRVEELGMKELLINIKQWSNTYRDSKNIQLSAKSEDDDVMDIPEEYIPAISELD